VSRRQNPGRARRRDRRFILTLPVFAALREQFPNAHLEVLGYAHIASLAKAGGLVDAVRSIEAGPLAAFFARNGTLENRSRIFAGFFYHHFVPLRSDGIFQANVARCSKAQFIVALTGQTMLRVFMPPRSCSSRSNVWPSSLPIPLPACGLDQMIARGRVKGLFVWPCTRQRQ